MISDTERNRIQAEAFRELKDKRRRITCDETLRAVFDEIVYETDQRIERSLTNAQTLLHELDRTRWRRLQNTQFVYWAARGGHPRILPKEGAQYQYLQEHASSFQLSLDADILEAMIEHERQLFDTKDAAVVYWRGWHVVEDPSTNSVFFNAMYCTAHIWDDQVHTEARRTAPSQSDPWFSSKLINSMKHKMRVSPDHQSKESGGWKVHEHLVFPSVLNQNIPVGHVPPKGWVCNNVPDLNKVVARAPDDNESPKD